MRPSWCCAVFALGLLAGCGDASTDDEPNPLTVVRRDSAGIEIVDNYAPVHDDTMWLWTSAEPVLTLGALDGPEAEMFGHVGDVVILSDGTVVVAEGQVSELRWFDLEGRHIATTGGVGGGPGEFRRLDQLLSLPGDTVLAWDEMETRLTLFTPEAQLARVVTLDRPPTEGQLRFSPFTHGVFSGPLGRLPDGTWIMLRQDVDMSRVGWVRGVASVDRWGPDGEYLGRLIDVPGEDYWLREPGAGGSLNPYGRQSSAAWDGTLIYSGNGDDYTIRVHDASGRLVRLIRRPDFSRPISADERAEIRDPAPRPDSALDDYPPERAERAREMYRSALSQREEALRATGFTTKEAYQRITSDGVGRIFVSGVDPAVFDTTGRFLAPMRIRHRWVGPRWAATVRYEDGVPVVVVHEVVERR